MISEYIVSAIFTFHNVLKKSSFLFMLSFIWRGEEGVGSFLIITDIQLL